MPENGETRPISAPKRRRAVRNINTRGEGLAAQTPYTYKRETKQQAAARIERELRMAAGMTSPEMTGSDQPVREPESQIKTTGDTRVFDAIDPVRTEQVRRVTMKDAAEAQREINEEIERRNRRRRRTAYTVLIAAGAVIALSVIVIIAARLLG